MRSPRSNANSISAESYREGEYFTTFSHKRGPAKPCRKEPTLRTTSWALSFSKGDSYVWFNFNWVSGKNISLLPLTTPCILPDSPFLSILPGDMCKSVLSSPTTWPFGLSCYFPCLRLSFTHVKIKGQIICWLWIGTVSLTAVELFNLQAAGGLEMGQSKNPTSRHPKVSARLPVSALTLSSVWGIKSQGFILSISSINSLYMMAVTALSSTEYKPNVLNSCFIGFKNKRNHHVISSDLLHDTQRMENTTWDSSLGGNQFIGVNPNDLSKISTFWGTMEEEGSCLLQFDLMEKLEISMTWAHEQIMPVKTQTRIILHVTWEHHAVPSGGLSLPVGHIPVCVYLCVCACNSSQRRN